jgi:creatinine amidohydrolase
MRTAMLAVSIVVVLVAGHGAAQRRPVPTPPGGVRLEDLTWQAAEARLRPDTVVVLPVGSGATEHGPHLPLGTDLKLAEHLARRVLARTDVVVTPPLSYHHYPAFLEYPGSISISLPAARDTVADIARSLARHGPRRFYVLNTRSSPVPSLPESAKVLAREGILLRFTDLRATLDGWIRLVQKQPAGLHADEIETSMMLHLDPGAVDMSAAPRDMSRPSTPFTLTRRAGPEGTYSASGAWGDATLATREKGGTLVDALVSAIVFDIEELRRTTPPSGAPGDRAPGSRAPAGASEPSRSGGDCLPGDERIIRGFGPAFSLAWTNQDAVRISQFWTADGDMVHPDGYIERTAQTIRENRTALFMRPEYRGSRHSLVVGQVRCITGDVAIADAKWELRGVTDAGGSLLPATDGLCTLVLRKTRGEWAIEAYRYSMRSTQNITRPTLRPRPGFPDR